MDGFEINGSQRTSKINAIMNPSNWPLVLQSVYSFGLFGISKTPSKPRFGLNLLQQIQNGARDHFSGLPQIF